MIDSDFIIKYTDALYAADAQVAPRYDEFRDMFSYGQIKSKTWLAQELSKVIINPDSICISGAWFGTLSFYLYKVFPTAKIKCLDLDARCARFINLLSEKSGDSHWLSAIEADMFLYDYKEHVIINTSCEHLQDPKQWVDRLPKGKLVVLQSTDYKGAHDHVSAVSSLQDFENKVSASFKKVHFKGELKLNVYNRYMLIGEI